MMKILVIVVASIACVTTSVAQKTSIQLRNGAHTTTLTSSASATASVVYALPPADGTGGQVLSTNGSGTLSWTASATSLGGLSDVKKLPDGSGFDNSIILGHTTTGTLNPPTTNAAYNYAFGADALRSITDGDGNIAVGFSSLYSLSTGPDNIAVGRESGYLVNGGDNNIAIGYKAGYSVVSANNTVSIGQAALQNTSGTTGSHNIAIGYRALQNGPSLENNIGVGREALKSVTSASSNIGFGYEAGVAVTEGDNNVLIGTMAGKYLTTGSSNVFIGYNAGADASFDTESNLLIIDNASTTSPLIYGNFGTDQLTLNGHVEVAIGTTTATAPFSIVGTGTQGAANVENVYLGTDVPTLFVRNTTDAADANAIMIAGVGGSSAGDPYIGFDVAMVGGWSIGVDNSDADKLKVLDSWNFKSDGLVPEHGVPVMTMTRQERRVGIGTESPSTKLEVSGTTKTSNLARNIRNDVTGGTHLVADTDSWIIVDRSASSTTITLPAASGWPGRELMFKTIHAQSVISASSNVVPLVGGAAGTAILPATDGAWATLVSDGTNWIIMQSGQ